MQPTLSTRLLRWAFLCALAQMPIAHAQDSAALQARYASLRASLDNNAFLRPLHLESKELSGELRGDAYARLDQPFAVAGPALQELGNWCDILILHLNVKACVIARRPAGNTLKLNIGRKFDQPLSDAREVEFVYKVVALQKDYLQVALNAEKGPLGTRDYRILLEVLALDARSSFLHLSYSYTYGMAARMATQGYLASIGRDKLGFSIVGHTAGGQPIYIGGIRGVIERNTMRYYLAIEAYLGALSRPPSEQIEKRLNDWHAAVERYPKQLHELDRPQYLEMKRKEIRRQRALPTSSD